MAFNRILSVVAGFQCRWTIENPPHHSVVAFVQIGSGLSGVSNLFSMGIRIRSDLCRAQISQICVWGHDVGPLDGLLVGPHSAL